MTTIPKSKGGHFETLKEMNRRHAREFKQEASATTTECPDDCHFGDHDTPAAPERGDQPKLIDQLLDAAIYAEDIDRRVAARVRIVKMFDQHSTLIAQRERLIEALSMTYLQRLPQSHWMDGDADEIRRLDQV